MTPILAGVIGFFVKLDGIILKFFTKVAHKYQRLTGKTCYSLAKVGVTICAISGGIAICDYFFHFLSKESHWIVVVVELLLVTWMFWLTTKLDKAEKTATLSAERVKPDVGYPTNVFVRLVMLYFAFMDVVSIWLWVPDMDMLDGLMYCMFRGYNIGFTIFLYFIAVDPLPPQKSKVREWIESFRAKLVLNPSRM